MGDEQQSDAQALLQLGQQVQHLGLHRHVQRGDRLVTDQYLGLRGDRPGDRHPLPLPAGELVRTAAGEVRVEPDRGQQFGDLGPAAGAALTGQCLGDDAPDGVAGVERRLRILLDQLDVLPLHPPGTFRRARPGLPAQENPPLVGFGQTHHHPCQRALAGAGLADQAHRLARPQGQ